MTDKRPPPRPVQRLSPAGWAFLSSYIVLVVASAAGVGLLTRRGLSSTSGVLAESGPVLAALIVGVLGAVIAHRAEWFRR